MIGLETELKYLGDEKAVALLERWAEAYLEQVHDPDDLGTDHLDHDWDKFDEHARLARELDQAAVQLLNLEELSDLQVLYYFGRDCVYGEHYEQDLARMITEHRAEASLRSAINRLMSRNKLLDFVIDGAKAVGWPSLAAELQVLRLRIKKIVKRLSR